MERKVKILIACEESQTVCKAFHALGSNHSKERSKTYTGIAEAMAVQWGGVLNG